jgi:hypothetical protein
MIELVVRIEAKEGGISVDRSRRFVEPESESLPQNLATIEAAAGISLSQDIDRHFDLSGGGEKAKESLVAEIALVMKACDGMGISFEEVLQQAMEHKLIISSVIEDGEIGIDGLLALAIAIASDRED